MDPKILTLLPENERSAALRDWINQEKEKEKEKTKQDEITLLKTMTSAERILYITYKEKGIFSPKIYIYLYSFHA